MTSPPPSIVKNRRNSHQLGWGTGGWQGDLCKPFSSSQLMSCPVGLGTRSGRWAGSAAGPGIPGGGVGVGEGGESLTEAEAVLAYLHEAVRTGHTAVSTAGCGDVSAGAGVQQTWL